MWFTLKTKWPTAADETRSLRERLLSIPAIAFRGPDIRVPENALRLVGSILDELGLNFTTRADTQKSLTSIPVPPDGDLSCLIPRGLAPAFPAFATPYQREAIAFSAPRAGSHLWHSPGAGKTFAAIAWCLFAEPPYVIVTRAAARRQFIGEISRFTNLRGVLLDDTKGLEQIVRVAGHSIDACRIRDDIDSSIKHRGRFAKYKPSKQADGSVAFFVLSWETLPDYAPALIQLKASSIVLDELHKGKSTRRKTAIVNADGTLSFEDLDNIASSAQKLTRAIGRKNGLTATPAKDRIRDLWAQLDLIEPGEWGPFVKRKETEEHDRKIVRYSGWAARYADAKTGAYGQIDTTGSSHEEELFLRAESCSHVVPRSVTHADLPPKRRVVIRIPVSEQAKTTGFLRDVKKAFHAGGTQLLELKLMEAAARKRTVIVDEIVTAWEEGRKIFVFTGRRKDAEGLGESVRKRLKLERSEENEDSNVESSATICGGNVQSPLFVAHGDHSTNDREDARGIYMAAKGAACIIGTFDAWGESMNLQDTDLALFCMIPYTPGMVDQSEGRFTRRGQLRPVLLKYFIAVGTIDEHIAQILLDKLPAVEKAGINDDGGEFGGQLAGMGNEKEMIASILSKIMEADPVFDDDD